MVREASYSILYKSYNYVHHVEDHTHFVSGEWFGIEWDDSSRGKHDGTKDGIRYFNCK